jgi:hypothetical protein
MIGVGEIVVSRQTPLEIDFAAEICSFYLKVLKNLLFQWLGNRSIAIKSPKWRGEGVEFFAKMSSARSFQ